MVSRSAQDAAERGWQRDHFFVDLKIIWPVGSQLQQAGYAIFGPGMRAKNRRIWRSAAGNKDAFPKIALFSVKRLQSRRKTFGVAG